MTKIQFGPEGYPQYYYEDGEDAPDDAIEVTPEQLAEARNFNLWLSPEGVLTTPPPPEPLPEAPKTLTADAFWNRFTSDDDDQLDAFDAAMRATSNPLRIRRLYAGYTGSVSMAEGDDLWNTIRDKLLTVFDEARVDEILA